MLFCHLLKSAGLGPACRGGEAQVLRVIIDSRRARPGDCFVAIRGTGVDGHRFVKAAVRAGCSAVVCEDASAVPRGVAFAVVEDTRLAAGLLAQAILDWPARKLTVAGVTGTKGKTTFTFLLRHILQSAGHKVGLMGTISYEAPGSSVPAPNTTPDPVQLADMAARMVAGGVSHLVMEVSSHALDQCRTAGIDFVVAAFTNLTGDHMDYHKTVANYRSAKRRLFESLRPGAFAVVNSDTPALAHSRQMAKAAEAAGAGVLWYGLDGRADVSARSVGRTAAGTRFVLCHDGRRATVRTGLIGRHNVANCLAAAAAGISLGVDLRRIASALSNAPQVPGRLQRVTADAPFSVVVDYAHTDDALLNVLTALRPETKGRLIVVFGCGGDRDRTKRPRMARVAERNADRVIVTSDNPRTEDPRAIIDQIMAGFSRRGRAKVQVEPDRRAAIGLAIGQARRGDVVLLAGKGHENYQIIGTTKTHFDDVEVAAEAIRRSCGR